MAAPLPLDTERWHLSSMIDSQAAASAQVMRSVHWCGNSHIRRLGCDVTYRCATDFTPRVGGSLRDLITTTSAARAFVDPLHSAEGKKICPAGTHSQSHSFLRVNASDGWVRMQLPNLHDGVIVLSNAAVGGPLIHWGEATLELPGKPFTAAPNAELQLNGKRLVELELVQASGTAGYSVARVPSAMLSGGSVDQLALRAINPQQELSLSQLLWH